MKQVHSYTDMPSDYYNVVLPDGEVVRFNRIWGGYRFTDEETALLAAGYEVVVTTASYSGVRGSLDWLEYEGHEYYGFSPWAAEAYTREDAPMPLRWNGYVFTDTDKEILRNGGKLLVDSLSSDKELLYGVHLSYELLREDGYDARWGIVPHFEEFGMPASSFTRETCLFLPVFAGVRMSQADIRVLRDGGEVKVRCRSKNGRQYTCRLALELDSVRDRWRLVPDFERRRGY